MTDEKTEKPPLPASANDAEAERAEESPVGPESVPSHDTESVGPMPPAAKEVPRQRPSRLAPLAVLLAILALLAAAFVWWEAERAAAGRDQAAAALDGTLAQVRSALENQASVLEQLARRDDQLEGSIAGRARDTAELDTRLRAAERALQERSGLSSAAREALARTEIEQYLRMANRATQLARDPAMALAALRVADDRLRELDDPALLPVREQVTAEMDALEALPKLDVEGIALRLGRMAARVDDLPLDSQIERTGVAIGGESAVEPGFWSRTWAAVRGALTSLVSVRRSDEQVTPLLAPDQQFFLRQNLRLELETARLAVLRGDAANYARSLRNAREWLTGHFDDSRAGVARMVNTLENLSRVQVEPDLPDISGSLEALRDAREDSVP
ncbi:MAG: uroporphyrinogen-III C-methyltransferase [Gammaproteobacteria bacterium]|nr:uroporphyrinogen-III C-methyltransferase [Gammaproteobacteria bacterium]